MSQDLICVSALPGGPAERVLSILQGNARSHHFEIVWKTDDHGFQYREVTGRLPICSSCRNALREVQLAVEFVLGTEKGIVLRDCSIDSKLLRHGNFSTVHVYGTQTSAIDYVMPISARILRGKDPEMNLRHAAFSVLAFLVGHPSRKAIQKHLEWCNAREEARRFREREFVRTYHETRRQKVALKRAALSADVPGLSGEDSDVQCCVEMAESGDFRHVWQAA